MEQVYTAEEVAAQLRVDPATIRRWCGSGKLAGVKVGRAWRISQRELERALREGVKEETPQRD